MTLMVKRINERGTTIMGLLADLVVISLDETMEGENVVTGYSSSGAWCGS